MPYACLVESMQSGQVTETTQARDEVGPAQKGTL